MTTEEKYICPMHPEITGKAGDKCSKCGMSLQMIDHTKMTTEEKYICPMHPEVSGKEGEKCTKCHMKLHKKSKK